MKILNKCKYLIMIMQRKLLLGRWVGPQNSGPRTVMPEEQPGRIKILESMHFSTARSVILCLPVTRTSHLSWRSNWGSHQLGPVDKGRFSGEQELAFLLPWVCCVTFQEGSSPLRFPFHAIGTLQDVFWCPVMRKEIRKKRGEGWSGVWGKERDKNR